jgi:hypothetical protein
MSVGRLAILGGVVIALIGFVLITNWNPLYGFIWNIQHADIVFWTEAEDPRCAAWRSLGTECAPIKRVIASMPYWAVLIGSIAAVACGVYMESSDRWKNTRL